MTKAHPSLLFSQEVAAIAAPLFKQSKVNCFSYSKVYPDGSRAELWSDAKALEHTFLRKKYIAHAYTPSYFSRQERYIVLQDKIEFYPKEVKESYFNHLKDQRELFDHDNCFLIVNKEKEFCEYFIFYSNRNTLMTNFYFNSLELLERFICYFKESATGLIKKVDSDRIVKAWRKEWDLTPANIADPCLPLPKNFLIAPFRPSKQTINLTKKEKQIGTYIIEGKSASEIARILKLSARTIESHINNMKTKLDCYKKSELVGQLIKCGLYDFHSIQFG